VVSAGVVVAVGLLLISFTAFELWGTGILTSQSQGRLRADIARMIPTHAAGPAIPALPQSSLPATAPPSPTPAPGQPVATIEIPVIDLDMVVVQGVEASDLALGPGHYPGTPLPGTAGNVAIAGHRTTYLHPFYDLTAIRPGTEIELTTSQGVFVYVAGPELAVAPSDVAVVGPDGANTLTLTTCNPRYSAATRLVLRATLASSQLFGPASTISHPVRPPAHPTPSDPAPPDRLSNGAARTDPAPLVGWGFLVVATLGIPWLWSRKHHRRRLVMAPAATGAAVALFFFYATLSPLLPAGF